MNINFNRVLIDLSFTDYYTKARNILYIYTKDFEIKLPEWIAMELNISNDYITSISDMIDYAYIENRIIEIFCKIDYGDYVLKTSQIRLLDNETVYKSTTSFKYTSHINTFLTISEEGLRKLLSKIYDNLDSDEIDAKILYYSVL